MDPNACLRAIDEADHADDIASHSDDLKEWLDRGGFAPQWQDFPRGHKRYKAYQSRRD